MRSSVQTSELVANLFQECDPTKGDYHGLCKSDDLSLHHVRLSHQKNSPTATRQNIFLLILTALMKMALTAWTFGMSIPAGIFLPTIAIGACLGRAMGLIT